MPTHPVDQERYQREQEETPPDLSKEAANMLELLARQSEAATLLSISSKAAQAVIKQF